MKNKSLLILVILLATNTFSSYAQNGKSSSPGYGIGVRLGDPTGISLKKYMKGKALELIVGRSYMFNGGRGYYNRRFDHRFEDWHRDYPQYRDLQYVGYSRSFPISFQLHYLFQKDLKGIDNLQWYWGLGAQFRFQKYYFDYQYKLDGSPKWIHARERVTDLDFGLDGILGLEYKMANVPLSFFGEVDLFMEVADNPFAFWLQGGVGIRYNF
jgi:hypothetical protein